MKLARSLAPLLAALAFAAATPPALAQEEPVTAGSEGVPAPKRTKHVQPVYPQEALAQGIRGIVILEIVLDKQGKVESTSVVRSVPGLDEAAVAAARQWEYTPTKVEGKPVRVRITVPVVFSLALPTVNRQMGIPELRQGISPVWPAGASGGGVARAEVTLEADGRVGSARILEGNAPWSDALLQALKTWRFAPPPEDEVLTFRVEAEFVSEGGGKDRRVSLEATGLQRSGLLEGPPASGAPAKPPTAVAQGAPPAAPAPQQPTPTQEKPAPPAQQPTPTQEKPAPAPQQPTPPQERPAPQQPAPAQPTPGQPTPPQPTPAQPPPTQPAPGDAPPPPPSPVQPKPAQPAPASPTPGRQAPPPQAAPAAPPAGTSAAAPPPVEVITAPPPALPLENGISAIRDVTLEPGVPDLTKGRRPVAPPFARMAGTTGTVEVAFSVGTAGTTTVQSSTGPDLLKTAAEQAVASWVFRRTRADRAYLVAVFNYGEDKSTATVRPQEAGPAGAAPTAVPGPTAVPPSGTAAPGSTSPAGTATPPAGTRPAPAGTGSSPTPDSAAPRNPAPPQPPPRPPTTGRP
jgi:TonB family protein